MSGYTRLTLVGTNRRVDVVLPDDEPVGRLIGEALDVANEPVSTGVADRRLARLDGRLLAPEETLAEAEIPDGSILRIVGLTDAPPAPVVLDVAEETAADLDGRSGRWGPGPRRWLATGMTAVTVLAALLVAGPSLGARRLTVSIVVTAVLLVAGSVLGRMGRSALGTTAIWAGTAAGIAAIASWETGLTARLGAVALLLSLTALGLGLGTSLGRAGVVGGGLGLVLLAGWAVIVHTLPPLPGAGVAAVVSAALLGLLPRIAATGAGLTRLDDLRAAEQPVRRRDVRQALRATHHGLTIATVAVAASATAAGVWSARGGTWPTLLAVLLAVVIAVRIRSFPLVAQVLTLVAAVTAVTASLLIDWLTAVPAARSLIVLLLIAVAVVALLVSIRPADPEWSARIRVITDRLELLAVVAMVPVLVGVFGVYPRLLASF